MAIKTGARVHTQHTVGQYGGSQQVSTSGTTAASTAIASACIRVFSATATFIKAGDSSVTATTSAGGYDIYLPANATYDLHIGDNTNVAAILSSGSDTLYISEIE